MITSPDRVTIWAAQLAANDFPPVCAMTGRPAEVWRRFKFATSPAWTYWLLILVCLGGIGMGGLSFLAGLIGRLVIAPLVRPRARVMDIQPGQYDRLVELRNLNPAFVAAMHQRQAARMA